MGFHIHFKNSGHTPSILLEAVSKSFDDSMVNSVSGNVRWDSGGICETA